MCPNNIKYELTPEGVIQSNEECQKALMRYLTAILASGVNLNEHILTAMNALANFQVAWAKLRTA